MLNVAILMALVLVGVSNVHAQLPTMRDLARDVDQAASRFEEKQNSFLGFKKLEMPKPLAGLLDIRFRKPQLPKFEFLSKLKNLGKPQFGSAEPTAKGPFLSGLSRLFTSREREPSMIDRMLGKSNFDTGSDSKFGSAEIQELSQATRGLQDHVGRMSRDVQTNATELFGGLGSNPRPQPPLRSARQHSDQSSSRY